MSAIEADSPAAVRLRDASLGWLTTVQASGQPQSSYVWFHFDGQDIVVRSQPHTAKVRNVRANPKAAFHLDGDGAGGGVVTVEAAVALLDGDLDPGRADAYVRKYETAMRTQLQQTPEQIMASFNTTLRLTPTRVRAW